MPITREQARAELARRDALENSTMGNYPYIETSDKTIENSIGRKNYTITPDQARAELARRDALEKEVQVPMAKSIYQNVMDFNKEQNKKSETWGTPQHLAKTARNVATIPGAVAELPLIPYNVYKGFRGQEGFYPSQMIGSKIDELTKGYTKPEGFNEELQESLIQSLGSAGPLGYLGKTLGKAAPVFAQKVGNYLQRANEFTPSNTMATVGGTVLPAYYSEQNPGDIGGTITTGVLGSLLGGKAPQVGKNIVNNAHAYEYALKNPIKTVNSKIAERLKINADRASSQLNSKDITQRAPLSDISEAPWLKKLQGNIEDVPFFGRHTRQARESRIRGLEGGVKSAGLEGALDKSGTQKLAQQGVKTRKQNIENLIGEKSREVEEGINKLAIYPNQKVQISSNLKNKQIAESILGEPLEGVVNKKTTNIPIYKTNYHLKETLQKFNIPESISDQFADKIGHYKQKIKEYAKHHKGKIPFHDFDKLRQEIDIAAYELGQISPKKVGPLRQLRDVMQEDVSDFLGTVNPNLQKQWLKRNKLVETARNKEKAPTKEMERAAKVSEENLTKNIIEDFNQTGQKMKVASKGLDSKGKEKLGFGIINNIGEHPTTKSFDLDKFHKFWNSDSMSKTSRKQLLHLLPTDSANSMKKLMGTLDNVEHSKSFKHKPGAGVISDVLHLITKGAAFIGSGATEMISRGLTNGKFVNWVAQGAHLKNPYAVEKHIEKLAKIRTGSKNMDASLREVYKKLKEKQEPLEKKKNNSSSLPKPLI